MLLKKEYKYVSEIDTDYVQYRDIFSNEILYTFREDEDSRNEFEFYNIIVGSLICYSDISDIIDTINAHEDFLYCALHLGVDYEFRLAAADGYSSEITDKIYFILSHLYGGGDIEITFVTSKHRKITFEI